MVWSPRKGSAHIDGSEREERESESVDGSEDLMPERDTNDDLDLEIRFAELHQQLPSLNGEAHTLENAIDENISRPLGGDF